MRCGAPAGERARATTVTPCCPPALIPRSLPRALEKLYVPVANQYLNTMYTCWCVCCPTRPFSSGVVRGVEAHAPAQNTSTPDAVTQIWRDLGQIEINRDSMFLTEKITHARLLPLRDDPLLFRAPCMLLTHLGSGGDTG